VKIDLSGIMPKAPQRRIESGDLCRTKAGKFFFMVLIPANDDDSAHYFELNPQTGDIKGCGSVVGWWAHAHLELVGRCEITIGSPEWYV
jgi:hypothetical protein